MDLGEKCPVCSHMEGHIISRFLRLPPGTPGRRGARSLARAFGLDRKQIQAHEKRCLGSAPYGGGG